MGRLLTLAFISIFLFTLVSALPQDSTSIDFEQPLNTTGFNTNNSQYLQGYTPTTLKTWMQSAFDSVYCLLTGCTISGDLTVTGEINVSNQIINQNLTVGNPVIVPIPNITGTASLTKNSFCTYCDYDNQIMDNSYTLRGVKNLAGGLVGFSPNELTANFSTTETYDYYDLNLSWNIDNPEDFDGYNVQNNFNFYYYGAITDNSYTTSETGLTSEFIYDYFYGNLDNGYSDFSRTTQASYDGGLVGFVLQSNQPLIDATTLLNPPIDWTDATDNFKTSGTSTVSGTSTFNGNTQFNQRARFLGGVSEASAGVDRFDIGVQVGTPRFILENVGFTHPIWQIDNEGLIRFFVPGKRMVAMARGTGNGGNVYIYNDANSAKTVLRGYSNSYFMNSLAVGKSSASEMFDVAGNIWSSRDNDKAYFGAGKDFWMLWDGSRAIFDSTTANAQFDFDGILYAEGLVLDSPIEGAQRYGLKYGSAGSLNDEDTIALTNRAANGSVEIQADNGASGSGGETRVARFEDDNITFYQDTHINGGNYLQFNDDTKIWNDGNDMNFNTTNEYNFYNGTGWGILNAHDFVTHTFNQSENPLEMFTLNQTAYNTRVQMSDLKNPIYTNICEAREIGNITTCQNILISNETICQNLSDDDLCTEVPVYNNNGKIINYNTECTPSVPVCEGNPIYEKECTQSPSNITQHCYTETTYPLKWIEGQSTGKLVEDMKGALTQQNEVMDIINTTEYGNVVDFDNGIMTENIWTQSKTIEDGISYIDKIKDKEKLKSKQSHYAYELIDGYELLNMEARVVALEGAVNEIFTILCDKNILKKEDGCL